MKRFVLLLVASVSIIAISYGFDRRPDVPVESENNPWTIELSSNPTGSQESPLCCTAIVRLNGVMVESFTCCIYPACDCALQMACGYIESQGGTCPSPTQL